MSKMQTPEMELVRFQNFDVVAASSVRISNVGNTVSGDLTISYKGQDYTGFGSFDNVSGFVDAINADNGTNYDRNTFGNITFNNDSLLKIYKFDNGEDKSSGSAINGTFVWSTSESKFVRKQ